MEIVFDLWTETSTGSAALSQQSENSIVAIAMTDCVPFIHVSL